MKAIVAGLLVVVLGAGRAGAHTALEVLVQRPTVDERFGAREPVVVEVRAVEKGPGAGPTLVNVQVDGQFLDDKGSLTRARPAFGGALVKPGRSERLRVPHLAPGRHELKVSYRPHGDEPEVAVSRRFVVEKGRPIIWPVALALAWGLIGYALWVRRRNSKREDAP